MLDKVNHIAIAVPDLTEASAQWQARLGVAPIRPLTAT